MDKQVTLSRDGEMLFTAMTEMARHFRTHGCATCLDNYRIFEKAMSAWLEREAGGGESVGDD